MKELAFCLNFINNKMKEFNCNIQDLNGTRKNLYQELNLRLIFEELRFQFKFQKLSTPEWKICLTDMFAFSNISLKDLFERYLFVCAKISFKHMLTFLKNICHQKTTITVVSFFLNKFLENFQKSPTKFLENSQKILFL